MELVIDTAQWENYSEVAALMQEIHEIHVHGRPDVYREAEHFFTEEKFKNSIVNPQELLLTARVKGKIVGICQVNFAPVSGGDITLPRERAYVDAICVKQEYQGQGIGTRLLQRAEEEASRKDICTLELMVWEFNEEVVRFYEHYGMKCQRMIMEKEIGQK